MSAETCEEGAHRAVSHVSDASILTELLLHNETDFAAYFNLAET